MATPLPDSEQPSATPPEPQRSARGALGWGLACAACAGGFWPLVFRFMGEAVVPNAELYGRLSVACTVIAFVAAIGGLFGAMTIGLFYITTNPTPRLLAHGALVTGAVGGSLTVPVIVACRAWLSPLASTTCLWAVVGFFAGVAAHRLAPARTTTHRRLTRAEWVLVRLLPLLALFALTLCIILPLLTGRYL